MMRHFAEVNIVAVDDNVEELEQIRKSLETIGVPCLPLAYRPEGIELPQNDKFPRVRLLFMDINLDNAGNATPEKCSGPIADSVKKIGPEGPCGVVFWSGITGAVNPEELAAVLQDKGRYPEMPDFIYCGSLDKTGFTSGNPQSLSTQIETLLTAQPLLGALVKWERRIAEAAGNTLSQLHECTQSCSTMAMDEKMRTLLSVIAKTACGKKNAADDICYAVETGLLMLLDDRLRNLGGDTVNGTGYSELWEKALEDGFDDREIGDIAPAGQDIAAKLNGMVYIERNDPARLKKTDRGVFVKIGVETAIKACFGEGTSKKCLLAEFLNISEIAEAQRESVLNSCCLGFVEISASCDYAQRKGRSYTYIPAILIPTEHQEYTKFTYNGKVQETKHDGIFRLDSPLEIHIGGRLTNCIVEMNWRYAVGLAENNPILGDPLFRFRKQVADHIAYGYTRYLARPGLFSF